MANSLRIYKGRVFHQRHGRLRHRLIYDVFSICLPLSEAKEISQKTPLFSFNHFNLFSLYEKDHMDAGYESLSMFVKDMLLRGGILKADEDLPQKIEILAYPRFFGRAFNPLTVFFCYDSSDHLMAILYQVRNTFGERHHYGFRITPEEKNLHKHSCDKRFYVSPFIEMDCSYHFSITPPSQTIAITIRQTQNDSLLLTASFKGKRVAATKASILRLALAYGQAGWKILAAIHWEALKLWLKGAVYQKRPKPPLEPIASNLSQSKEPKKKKGKDS